MKPIKNISKYSSTFKCSFETGITKFVSIDLLDFFNICYCASLHKILVKSYAYNFIVTISGQFFDRHV